jgi:hypothetical protein
MCVTYSIRFIKIRCNKITQYENLKKQECFKLACVTQEQKVHSFQQVSREKLFDIETKIKVKHFIIQYKGTMLEYAVMYVYMEN